jgi:hypothetical protein
MENRIVNAAGFRPPRHEEYMPPAPIEILRLLKKAFRQYYKKYKFDAYAGTTAELMKLLTTGAARCRNVEYEPGFTLPEESEDEAKRLCGVFRRQKCLFQVRAALHVFADQEYDLLSSKHGALYYPEPRMYVYCGHLSPNTLLRILEEPDCGQAALFIPALIFRRGRPCYLLFERAEQRGEGS